SRGQWRAENGRRPRMRPLALSGLRATKRRALAADGHGNGTGRRASMAPARSPGKRSAPGAARPESAPGLAPAGETESLEAAAPRMRPSALSGLRALSVLFRNRQGTADDGTRAVAHQSITVHLQHGRVAGRYPHSTFALQPPVLAGRLQPGDEGPDARARVRQPRHGHEYAVALLILEAGRAEHEADRLPILRLQCESVRIFHGENLRKPGQQQQHEQAPDRSGTRGHGGDGGHGAARMGGAGPRTKIPRYGKQARASRLAVVTGYPACLPAGAALVPVGSPRPWLPAPVAPLMHAPDPLPDDGQPPASWQPGPSPPFRSPSPGYSIRLARSA